MDSAADNSARPRRRWPLWLALAMALIAVLLVDMSPDVPAAPSPTPAQVEQARDAIQTMRHQLIEGDGQALVRFDATELGSMATLASRLGSPTRFDTTIAGKSLRLRASRPLPGPLWLNLRADISADSPGGPAIHLRLGNLPAGRAVSAALIEGARRVAGWRGVDMPPLDEMIRDLRIDADGATARVHFPVRPGTVGRIAGLVRQPPDGAVAGAIYCRLRALDRTVPSEDMALIVRRAFAAPRGGLSADRHNRAALVALAVWTTGPRAASLADGARGDVDRCGRPSRAALIHGRTDLAMHWALSAALAASFGGDVGQAMGEWKELADSRPGGSGFSFIDLAADRSGLAIAALAVDPDTAEATAARLRNATMEDLLSLRALALSEGIDEAEFARRYANLDSRNYAAAVARIDRILAGTAR